MNMKQNMENIDTPSSRDDQAHPFQVYQPLAEGDDTHNFPFWEWKMSALLF